jgi:hypothetical protein
MHPIWESRFQSMANLGEEVLLAICAHIDLNHAEMAIRPDHPVVWLGWLFLRDDTDRQRLLEIAAEAWFKTKCNHKPGFFFFLP